MKNIVSTYIQSLQEVLKKLNQDELCQVATLLKDARDKGQQIFIFGNGGSSSTASHFACDINKGVSYRKEKKFKVICLNDNLPTLLAYSNDVGYKEIFQEQLKNFLQAEDLVIAISGSGNSTNIIRAIEFAKSKGAITVGITGFNGGMLKKIADFSVNAQVNDMQLSEDIHVIWLHVMMKCLL